MLFYFAFKFVAYPSMHTIMYVFKTIKWLTIVWISVHVLFSNVYCQQNSRRFSEDVLASPIDYAQWFDSNIEIDSVPIYEFVESSRCIVLDFGYASASIQNDLQAANDNRQPMTVDLVFTGYPIKKEDWITNYYTLLANRVNSLLEFDNRLNDNAVEWRLVIQANCVTSKDAISMFHGAVISTEIMVPNRLAMLQGKRVDTEFFPLLNTPHPFISSTEETATDLAKIESILYPTSIFDRNMETYLPKSESRGRKEPKCSNLRTRMQKPKRSIWSRIFR
ncbi:MAG: hypothetical protein PHE03_12850 [Bacteroidales bacterium]|nr:hypothetical protein [Bacteroidales bacterium]MDD3893179.1 hypothetical protein [Bacteroidales bacterium]